MRLDLGVQTRWEMASPAPFFHPSTQISQCVFVCVCVSADRRTFWMILSTPAKLKVAFGGMETLKPFLCWEGTVGAEPGGPSGSPGVRGLSKEAWF